MTHLFFGLLWVLLAFSILGFGPSLFLGSSKRDFGFSLSVAPAIGFVVVTVTGTYLTQLDIPVGSWAGPVSLVGAASSLLLVLLRLRVNECAALASNERSFAWAAGGFAITMAIVVSPQIIGGLDYSILRGNGGDAFNYIAEADYLGREPFSWAQRVDPQTLVNRDQSYERARELVTGERWSTGMMLAFASHVAQVPPYVFEYSFSLVCLLLSFGPAFSYARSLNLPPIYSSMTAAAICSGFWAQVILDTRAQSQLNSIPVLLLLMLLISRIEDRDHDAASWAHYVLTGVTVLSLGFLYVEIIPLTLLGLAIYFVTRLSSLRPSFVAFRGYALTISIAFVGAVPLFPLLVRFVEKQLAVVNRPVAVTWHLAYYPWLYSSPLAGFWGFGPLESSATAMSNATGALAAIVGLVLTVLLVFALIFSLRKGSAPLRLAGCVALAAALEFTYFVARGQLWAAAKGLSFGYAFFILCLLGYCLTVPDRISSFDIRKWPGAVKTFALIFLISENLLGIVRPALAEWNQELPHYLIHHGEYRRHSWDLSAFHKVLDGQKGITVWLNVSNPWLAQYLTYALSQQVKLINIGANLDVEQLGALKQERSLPPQYVITDSLKAGLTGDSSGVVASNRELSLVQSNAGGVTLVSVKNANGMESSGSGSFFWMGDKPTTLDIRSVSNTCANFSASLTLGPSSELPYRTLMVQSPDRGALSSVVVHDGSTQWQVPVRAGTNQISISIKEKVERYLATDQRPLMLRVDRLQVAGGACKENP